MSRNLTNYVTIQYTIVQDAQSEYNVGERGSTRGREGERKWHCAPRHRNEVTDSSHTRPSPPTWVPRFIRPAQYY